MSRSGDIVLLPLTSVTNANVTSRVQALPMIYGYAVQAIWTGAAITGTIKLQCSLDYSPGSTTSSTAPIAGHWSDITDSSQAVSGPGSYVWNIYPAMYPWVRCLFTYTSGTGTLYELISIKG